MVRLKQSVEFCLEQAIGSAGITTSELELELARTGEILDRLAQSLEESSLPLLTLPAKTDDLPEIEELAERIADTAHDVIICGTGGSSLGGQALAQIAGWRVPTGSEGLNSGKRPRLHFLDNIDSFAMDRILQSVQFEQTHVLLISKSGSTAETLAQGLIFLDAFIEAGLEDLLPRHFTGLSDPMGKHGNGLRDLCAKYHIPVLDHVSGLGGRFSALSNVGLLPASIAGVDIAAVRAGALDVLEEALAASPIDSMPACGAAINVAFLKQRGINISVLFGYGDRFERFTRWHAQLWAESLGKDGLGMTPVAALGPVDQHSQLQLFLDGPEDKLYTFVTTKTQGTGGHINDELAHLAGAQYLGGKRLGDLVDTMQRATAETLARKGRPVRTLHIDSVEPATMGELMMHFMLETVIAADLLGVDPFNQPAVEDGKVLARRYLGEI